MEANFFPAVAFAEIKRSSSQTRCLWKLHTRSHRHGFSVRFSSVCSQAPVRHLFGFFSIFLSDSELQQALPYNDIVCYSFPRMSIDTLFLLPSDTPCHVVEDGSLSLFYRRGSEILKEAACLVWGLPATVTRVRDCPRGS